MKKILLMLLSLTLSVSAFAACGGDEDKTSSPNTTSQQETKTYTVTFKQSGEADVVKTVEKGDDLTDVPSPAAKTGYTVVWDRTDFSDIQQNLTVNAVATANEYTITYDANGGTVTPATQKVTYDSVPGTFAIPRKANHDFIAWTYDNVAIQATSKWTIASNVTLVASWQEVLPEIYTISFVQDGQDIVKRQVEAGGTLTDIPTPANKKGYNVVWERTEFVNVTDNVTVNAVETAKEYTVTYDAAGGSVAEATKQVTYDVAPGAFATPTRTGYQFTGWSYDGKTVTATDLWQIDGSVTLVANWQAKTYSLTLDLVKGTLTGKPTTVEVTFGKAYDLGTPTRKDYVFKGWTCGSVSIAASGTWGYDLEETNTVKANWEEEEGLWTPNY